jgi:hypothetical protein
MQKTFDSISDLVLDPIFERHLSTEIERMRLQRVTRPAPRKGFYYPRDWFDQMSERSQFNAPFFQKNIEQIWHKRSSLPSCTRRVIQAVCELAIKRTFDEYSAMKEVTEEIPETAIIEEPNSVENGHVTN